MTVGVNPVAPREFARCLAGLLARLDQGAGWCGVFWRRDPDGMRACLEGRQVPPWDVVEALLQDLAAQGGADAGAVAAEAARARALHAAALAAHDALPGARELLGDRLEDMLRERHHAAERRAALRRQLASAATREQADALRAELAWADDDHARATARCAELRARITEWERRAYGGHGLREAEARHRPPAPAPGDGGPAPADGRSAPADGRPAPAAGNPAPVGGRPAPAGGRPAPVEGRPAPPPVGRGALPAPTPTPAPGAPARPKRRRGGARFAGEAAGEPVPVAVPPAVVPDLPAPAAGTGRTPRGARFAGAAESAPPREAPVRPPTEDDRREVAGSVAALARLRGEGRGGEAHALLAQAAGWPAVRFPLLAEELGRAGLGADWTTLLWEAASLPADHLVDAADALRAAGRGADAEQILRQGVARPVAEVGRAALGLAAQGRHRAARAWLDACVRVRSPQDAAGSAEPDPGRLIPLLLEAARGVSGECHQDLAHALRVAGFTV
ncbi:hypothetical protein TU94_27140 [Streptomyces cyaneogriseus subsp. noncyanogenus]|uniref:UL36 very large tegument protein n=1 Tax=Streptomyces cyaneogriseus subsp. noncyanogenus TaxID=477245 RepID=A0A0C5GJF8_9ACTN|nr:hypothetical protein [Streptomyces cyaneogriseus]AJP04586.1 hypothetical protein TU94_27140 [Streptomyces cyaneogriseus subsp. noncyanogenus]